MSFLNLLQLDDYRADIVILAVRQWCMTHDSHISDDNGKMALEIAVRIARCRELSAVDLLSALSAEMLSAVRPVTGETHLRVNRSVSHQMEATL